jgi:hypothetical protein
MNFFASILNNILKKSKFQAPWRAPATKTLGKKMSYNVPAVDDVWAAL